MNPADNAYLDILEKVMEEGEDRGDRTGTGTRSLFGAQARYDLTESFPLITSKKVFFKGVVVELLWFLSGDTNIKYLLENNVHIWDEWADEKGDLGPVYGRQWRDFGGVDQIAWVVREIQKNPFSRRLIVSGWNPPLLENMALPPCHTLFQFYVSADGSGLSCQLYQRSADLFLGVPFNIASYSLLTHLVAKATGLQAKEFVHTIGDAHVYHNHFEQVRTQLSRRQEAPALPTIEVADKKDIFRFEKEDIALQGYEPLGGIKAPIAV